MGGGYSDGERGNLYTCVRAVLLSDVILLNELNTIIVSIPLCLEIAFE